jgi:HEAT repeat protein
VVKQRDIKRKKPAARPRPATAKKVAAKKTAETTKKAEDPRAARLRVRDPAQFVSAANHLLLQRDDKLTALVSEHVARLVKIVSDKGGTKLKLDAIRALVTLGAAATLSPLLHTEADAEVLGAIASALAGPELRVSSERAVSRLLAKLDRPTDNWLLHYEAMIALRYFDDPRVDAALIRGLEHAESSVRREAVYGLGHRRVVSVVPTLIDLLRSKHPQLIAAAGEALTRIGTAEALAALEDRDAYDHALKLTNDFVQGRFAIRSLKWFRVDDLDEDLIKLATKNEDTEVKEGACDALVHRGAQHKLAELAQFVLAHDDPSWTGRFLVEKLIRIASKASPDAAVVSALGAVLGRAREAALDEVLDGTTQHRYRIKRVDANARATIAHWRDALVSAIASEPHRTRAGQLLSTPA